MDHEQITGRQGFFLLSLFLLGNLVTATGAKGMQAGWLLFISLALVSIPLFWLYLKAAGRRSAGQVFTESLGKVAGTIVTVVYCALAILLAGDAIRLFADFIVINDLNDAGAWGNTGLLTLTVLFLLFCNMRSLGKAAWAILPLVIAMLLINLALTAEKMELQRLLPIFAERSAFLGRGWIGSFAAILAPAVFPILTLGSFVPKNWNKGVFWAGIVICGLMSLLTLRDAAILGFPAVSMFRFPIFAAANTLRHSEILVSAAFVVSQPFRTALCLRYVQECLTWWKPRFCRWYPPLILGLSVLSGSLSWSSEQVRWRTTGEIVLAILLLTGPLAVVIAERIKARKRKA